MKSRHSIYILTFIFVHQAISARADITDNLSLLRQFSFFNAINRDALLKDVRNTLINSDQATRNYFEHIRTDLTEGNYLRAIAQGLDKYTDVQKALNTAMSKISQKDINKFRADELIAGITLKGNTGAVDELLKAEIQSVRTEVVELSRAARMNALNEAGAKDRQDSLFTKLMRWLFGKQGESEKLGSLIEKIEGYPHATQIKILEAASAKIKAGESLPADPDELINPILQESNSTMFNLAERASTFMAAPTLPADNAPKPEEDIY